MNVPRQSAYSRYAPFIREYIYREKWDVVYGIQEEAAEAIFEGGEHLLIAAGTASGKTEAVFFPVLSVLETLFSAGEKPLVLYVSPLKALINDQAQRLDKLLCSGKDSGEAAITIQRWHGDVDGNSKSRFLEDPSGVLLITPESLEALLLRKPRELGRIFGALLFVVIDEVHVFMGSDRGSQLICQLARVEDVVRAPKQRPRHGGPRPGGPQEDADREDAARPGGPQENAARQDAARPGGSSFIRRIGLSATLGNYDGACRWLAQGSGLSVIRVEEGSGSGKELSLALDYHTTRKGKSETLYLSLYGQCRNKRVIIFTNSRLEAEECAASLSALAAASKEGGVFRVHHGSVSALLRDEAEERLKSGEGPQAICATATLELGIDIGDLDRIIQLGPPWSVAAFVQRLGRSGRRSGRAEMYFGVTGPAVQESARRTPVEELRSIPWELLRTMAVVQLYLEEKWIEPPEEKPLPYSLLIHQCLGILASLGEHGPEALARRVLSLPPFSHIPPEDFRAIMAWLTDCGCIGTTENGTLILGIEGERIVNRYGFYPIFPGEETYRVILEGREIGTVNFVPDPLSVLAVGGRRWTVKSVDPWKREIWVAETGDEGNERLWRGGGGGVHRRIAETMRRILAEEPADVARYPYLSASAREALESGRRSARLMGITGQLLTAPGEGGGDGEDNEDGGDGEESEGRTVFLFPWTGSAGMRTIAAVLRNDENRKALRIGFLKEEADLYFCVSTKLKLPEFRSSLAASCQKAFTAPGIGGLIPQKELPYRDKYDYLLPPGLLAKQYAANMLDQTALESLARL